MEGEGYKEVYFHLFCDTCKHRTKPMVDEPCNECLDNPTNLYSHKPVKYEEDAKKKKQKEQEAQK